MFVVFSNDKALHTALWYKTVSIIPMSPFKQGLSNRLSALPLINSANNLNWNIGKLYILNKHSALTCFSSAPKSTKPMELHYRQISSAPFLQQCFTGIVWTLSRFGVEIEAGIVEGIGRGFMGHSTVLLTCLSRRWSCWISAQCLEGMNWFGMIGDLIEFQGRGILL